MERLTERDGNQWNFIACRDCWKPHCTGCGQFREQAARLAAYEDAEEQRSLKITPCDDTGSKRGSGKGMGIVLPAILEGIGMALIGILAGSAITLIFLYVIGILQLK